MSDLDQALAILKNDGLVIFPTETVYGIGCRLGATKTIERLYQIKARDFSKPTSVVVDSLEMAKEYVIFNSNAETLAEKFWPGPLTLVLPAKSAVTRRIQSPNKTLGIRVPAHPFLLQLLKKLKEPLLAPSANLAGEAPSTNLTSVDSRLKSMVDYVVNENTGGEKPSTVLDLTKDKPTVLREGSIKLSEIEETLKGGMVG